MVFLNIARYFHGNPCLKAAEKSLLATLRKKTGYTFSNCKKALELHNNNLGEAEKWLKEQAQQLGWSKATKLEGRQTRQGLIGVLVDGQTAAMVEVNCETDFVARNKEFHNMVNLATSSVLNLAKNRLQPTSGSVKEMGLEAGELNEVQTFDGKKLSDHLALMIGTVGENASLRRAFCYNAPENIIISGYAHPSGLQFNNVLLGKFGGVLALKAHQPHEDIQKLAKDLCQHIVGMNPSKIGNPETDEPNKVKEDEDKLIFQEYLLEEDITVGEILEENNVEIINFKRFECGEDLGTNLDLVETCQ